MEHISSTDISYDNNELSERCSAMEIADDEASLKEMEITQKNGEAREKETANGECVTNGKEFAKELDEVLYKNVTDGDYEKEFCGRLDFRACNDRNTANEPNDVREIETALGNGVTEDKQLTNYEYVTKENEAGEDANEVLAHSSKHSTEQKKKTAVEYKTRDTVSIYEDYDAKFSDEAACLLGGVEGSPLEDYFRDHAVGSHESCIMVSENFGNNIRILEGIPVSPLLEHMCVTIPVLIPASKFIIQQLYPPKNFVLTQTFFSTCEPNETVTSVTDGITVVSSDILNSEGGTFYVFSGPYPIIYKEFIEISLPTSYPVTMTKTLLINGKVNELENMAVIVINRQCYSSPERCSLTRHEWFFIIQDEN